MNSQITHSHYFRWAKTGRAQLARKSLQEAVMAETDSPEQSARPSPSSPPSPSPLPLPEQAQDQPVAQRHQHPQPQKQQKRPAQRQRSKAGQRKPVRQQNSQRPKKAENEPSGTLHTIERPGGTYNTWSEVPVEQDQQPDQWKQIPRTKFHTKITRKQNSADVLSFFLPFSSYLLTFYTNLQVAGT